MPRRNVPGAGPSAPTVSEDFAALGAGHFMALAASATTLGYAASIHRRARPPQYHRHQHRTPHRRASLPHNTPPPRLFVSLVMGAARARCARRADLRLPLVLAFLHARQPLMSVVVPVPLAVNPVAYRDIRAGGAPVLRVVCAGPAHDNEREVNEYE
ncbi:hypothetical protein K438DRAFT_1980912 [Mycena galopus ATCC 62051]|nr:hypothetical protein K438DRAFT_1980912 [Mycena galopus ATCC 62051]